MELGGSDPFIIRKDGDVELAVDLLVSGRMSNCGQICFSPKRIIVHSTVYDQVLQKLLIRIKNLKIGDPSRDDTELGPLARADILDNLLEQFNRIKQHGNVRFVLGGKRYSELPNGNFAEPTIIETQDLTNPCMKEELFGPV